MNKSKQEKRAIRENVSALVDRIYNEGNYKKIKSEEISYIKRITYMEMCNDEEINTEISVKDYFDFRERVYGDSKYYYNHFVVSIDTIQEKEELNLLDKYISSKKDILTSDASPSLIYLLALVKNEADLSIFKKGLHDNIMSKSKNINSKESLLIENMFLNHNPNAKIKKDCLLKGDQSNKKYIYTDNIYEYEKLLDFLCYETNIDYNSNNIFRRMFCEDLVINTLSSKYYAGDVKKFIKSLEDSFTCGYGLTGFYNELAQQCEEIDLCLRDEIIS